MPQSAMSSRKPSGTVPRSSPITTQRCVMLSCAVAASSASNGICTDALLGGKAVRHQVKPLQAEHMIEPDRAGIAHRGPQHLPVWLEGLHFEPAGIEPGTTPV